MKKELSRIGGMKAFPQNIVVKAFLTTQITEGTESVPLTVETNNEYRIVAEGADDSAFCRPESRIFYDSSHLFQ